ncbi:MAG TPA: Spy/CpxP family protein refolding chaperone [Steroidobacteraceae bacterium]
MNANRTGLILAVLVLGMAGTSLAQQPDSAARPRMRMRMQAPPVNVEHALRMREQLKLSDSQVSQLERMRREIVTQRQNVAREMIDLRSRIRAGTIDREAARKQMESQREQMRRQAEQRREQLEKILTAEQREQLQKMHREAMRERPGRGHGYRGYRGYPPPRNRWRWN